MSAAAMFFIMVLIELLGDGALAKQIMDTDEPEKLMTLHEKITLPDDLIQQWSDGLKKILHESNSAKVNVNIIFRFI